MRRLRPILEVAGMLQTIRECDGLFECFGGLRRRFYRHVFPLLSREGAKGGGNLGGYSDKCGDRWKDHNALLVFGLYTRLSGWFSFRGVRMELWMLPPYLSYTVPRVQADLLALSITGVLCICPTLI